MNEEKKQTIKQLNGILRFPYKDTDGLFTAKLLLRNGDDKLILNNIMEDYKLEIKSSVVNFNDIEYDAINIKSKFNFPVFEKNGLKCGSSYIINDGAKVSVMVNFKPYEFKEKKSRFVKKGLSAYIQGIVVIENGAPNDNAVGFSDFNLNDLPF